MLLELFGHAFGDEMNGKAAGVGANDGTGFAELRNAREEIALDFEIFGDDFDDPVGFSDAWEIIFKIADRDFFGESRSEKGGWARFLCGFEACTDDLVAVGSRGVGLEIGRNDVEKNAR